MFSEVVGVDEDAYPLDAGSTMRYQPAFAALPPRHSLPAPLDLVDIDRFLDTATDIYRSTRTDPLRHDHPGHGGRDVPAADGRGGRP